MSAPAQTAPQPLAQALPLACGATLPNRLAKAAMSEQLGTPEGAPSPGLLPLYRRWGQGGASLLITGNVMVDGAHISEAGNVVVEGPAHQEALGQWAAAAREGGAQVWVQLNHPGRQTPRALDPAPVAPSAVPLRVGAGAFAPARALESAEVEALIGRFATAAAAVCEAGFDGVQLHAAHGYLLSQFLSPLTNQREDAWGGDPERRRRLLIEVVAATRSAVGPGKAVSVKINSADFQRGGFSEAEAEGVLRALGAAGVDLIELSGGTYERTVMFDEGLSDRSAAREAFFIDFAQRARAATDVPLMLTGGLRSRAGMVAALEGGAVDVLGLARPLAVEPELPQRLLADPEARAREVRLRTGLATLDSILPGVWYQAQIKRLAEGLEPEPGLSRARALWGYGLGHLRAQRLRRGFE